MLPDARYRSLAVRLLGTVQSRVCDALAASRTAGTVSRLHALDRFVGRAARSSGTGRLVRRLHRYGTASFCWRWLTADPDPEVIVIDLRETRTVGPLLALVDRAAAPVVRAAPRARLTTGATRVATVLRTSRTGRLLSAAFEPPEPIVPDSSRECPDRRASEHPCDREASGHRSPDRDR